MVQANQNAQLVAFNAATAQVIPSGRGGVLVKVDAAATVTAIRFYNGTSASDPQIAVHNRDTAGETLMFPPGFMPEFSDGLYAVRTGSGEIRVYTA